MTDVNITNTGLIEGSVYGIASGYGEVHNSGAIRGGVDIVDTLDNNGVVTCAALNSVGALYGNGVFQMSVNISAESGSRIYSLAMPKGRIC